MLLCLLYIAAYPPGAVGIYRPPEVPGHLQLMVDLYNHFVRYFLSFDYDFGNRIALITGKATVRIFRSIELLARSKVPREERKGILELKCPLGFQIRPKNGQQGLDFLDCFLELRYLVDSSAEQLITRPTYAWIHSCNTINYLNYTKPKDPNTVLPLLSEAILAELVDLFTFNGFPPQVGFQDLKKLYRWLLYDSIMDGAKKIEGKI